MDPINVPEWAQSLPEELTVEHQGQTIPLRQHPFVTEAKDLPSFAKGAYDAHKAFGSRVKIPANGATPEEIKDFKDKVYQAGIFKAPPDKYEVARPDSVPENAWSDEIVGELTSLASKHGLSQEAVADLVALDAKRFGTVQEAASASSESAWNALNSRLAEYNRGKPEGQQITAEHLKTYGGRWLHQNKKTPEDIARAEQRGWANDPDFLWDIAQAGIALGEDISTIGATELLGDAEFKAADASDPSHPDHQKWLDGNPAVVARTDEAKRKKYGTKEA